MTTIGRSGVLMGASAIVASFPVSSFCAAVFAVESPLQAQLHTKMSPKDNHFLMI
jgi:hypothetical protein